MRLGLAASPTGLDNLKVCRFVLIFNIFGEKYGYWKDPKNFFLERPFLGTPPYFQVLMLIYGITLEILWSFLMCQRCFTHRENPKGGVRGRSIFEGKKWGIFGSFFDHFFLVFFFEKNQTYIKYICAFKK